MRIVYLLLSPTFGMHQYTADLANRVAQHHEVHLVTTTNLPRDRYTPSLRIHTPLTTTGTGFSREGFQLRSLRKVHRVVRELRPDLVHFPGPHLWNVLLVRWLRRRGIPVIHTIHDPEPHAKTPTTRLHDLWNGMIVRAADRILVHGRRYRDSLIEGGAPRDRICHMPLLHLFLSYQALAALNETNVDTACEPFALFFGRLHEYKGIRVLLEAWDRLPSAIPADRAEKLTKLIVAGEGHLPERFARRLPRGVEIRNRRVGDAEAIDLFRRCGLVILPYTGATQSALIAAAYRFAKPVLVTRSGALPESVEEGETGFIIEPDDSVALANAVVTAFGDPDRLRAMGKTGHAWYERRRSEETYDLLSLYAQYGTKVSDGPGS